MSKEYKLTTLKDIFDTVPIDRIEDLMKELSALLIQCKTIDVSMKAVAHLTVGDAVETQATWPEPVIWVDDGEGNIVANVILNDEEICTVSEKVTP